MSNKELHFISGVGWRYDTEHSMLRRLEGHDYKGRSIYQITITLAERGIPRLGTLMKDVNGKAIVALSSWRACQGLLAADRDTPSWCELHSTANNAGPPPWRSLCEA